MHALKVTRLVDEAFACVLPELRSLVGTNVEIIVLAEREPRPSRPTLSVDELIARRRPRPEGLEPVTVDAMNEAIGAEAVRHAGV